MRFEDLQPDAVVRGILPDAGVTVVSVEWHGSDALTLVYRGPNGKVADEILYRHDEARLAAVETGANLTLLMAPDRGYLAGPHGDDPPRTNLLQTYLDTWHAGGRGQEAAETILEQRLRPAW